MSIGTIFFLGICCGLEAVALVIVGAAIISHIRQQRKAKKKAKEEKNAELVAAKLYEKFKQGE